MDKKRLLLVVVAAFIVGAVIILFLLTSEASPLYYTGREFFAQLALNQLGKKQVVQKLAVTKNDMESGNKMYSIQGHFTGSLYMFKGFVRGDFLIDGDQTNTALMVYLTKPSGYVGFGEPMESSASAMHWTYKSSQEVMEKVQPGKKVELRIFVNKTINGAENKSFVQDQHYLDRLVTPGQPDRDEQILMPTMVGVLE